MTQVSPSAHHSWDTDKVTCTGYVGESRLGKQRAYRIFLIVTVLDD